MTEETPGAAPVREYLVLAWLAAAVAGLEAAVDEINALNVFPVADADTGTNMLVTMRATARAATRAGTEQSGTRIARAAVAAQRVDLPGAQLDPAQRMVAGVGDEQLLPLQGQALRAVERGLVAGAVHEVGGPQAELAQDATGHAGDRRREQGVEGGDDRVESR